MQDEVNHEDSEQNEVDGMKKGAATLFIFYFCYFIYSSL